jgi:formylmethanofuran dehydrogenase subunit B
MRLLDTRQLDVVLIAGSPHHLPSGMEAHLQQTRFIVIGPRVSESPLAAADIAIDTGVAGIHEGGMALRMDDVPLPLRQVLSGPISAMDTVRAIERRVRSA